MAERAINNAVLGGVSFLELGEAWSPGFAKLVQVLSGLGKQKTAVTTLLTKIHEVLNTLGKTVIPLPAAPAAAPAKKIKAEPPAKKRKKQ